jgi:hypothetical protein
MESELLTNALKIISSDSTFFNEIDDRIKNLFEQAKEDSTVSRFNIRDKSLLISTYRTKWFMILTKEKSRLKQLQKKKSDYLESAAATITASGTALPKVAIRSKLESSPEVIQIEKQIEAQEEVVNFLNGIRAIFDDFSFTINNSLNALEQENS